MQRFQLKVCALACIFTVLFVWFSGISDAATITWIGGGSDNLASTDLNWAGGLVPQNSDNIIFDITSSKDCTWDLPISLTSINISPEYSGTVTFDADVTITGNFNIQGGTVIQISNVFLCVASPPSAPDAITDPAANINGNAATLNATINPDNSETTVFFEWGPDTYYGNSTAPESIGGGTSDVSFSQNLTGLSINTTYHLRVVATNALGTSYGDDMSFTTSGGTTVSGTISSDTTWTYTGSPYIVTGNIFIYGTSSEPVLTIEPGVEVRFNGLYYLNIGYSLYKGRLIAQGTAANPILFTSNNTTPSAGNWYGIRFYNHATTESTLDYVTVEYAGFQYGGMYVYNSSPSISNVTVRNNNNSGIMIGGSSASPFITNSIISGNASYGIHATGTSMSQVIFSTITDNASYAVYSLSSVLVINHCNISGNGDGIYTSTGNITDARFNWWGDVSGPSGQGPGTGQSISSGITYEPWLATSYTYPFYNKDFNASHQEFNPLNIAVDYTFLFSENSDWFFAITDSSGSAVKSYTGSGSGDTVVWDGKDDTGVIVPDGTYKYQLSSSSLSNGTQSAPIIGDVLVGVDLPHAEITSPIDGQFINELTLDIQGIATDNNDFSSYKVEYGAGSAPTSWTLINSSTSPVDTEGNLATLDLTNLTELHYTIRLSVYDLTGNIAISLVGINRGFEIVDLNISNPYFSPDADGLKDTTTITANITYDSYWIVDIKNSADIVIRSFNGSGTSISSTWDGKDSSGILQPEGEYSLLITATEPVSGEVTSLTGTVTISFAPPIAVTESVTDLSISSATLNGVVNPKGSDTSVFFEWGVDTAYGNSTPPQAIGSGAADVLISDILTGLSINTTYHYRIVATNTYGTTYGSDMDFTIIPITLSITYPLDNDSIYRTDVMVRGAVTNISGNETGVIINGKVAVVYNGVFFVNHLPLQEGQNIINVDAVDTDGYTATSSIIVNADTSVPHITLRSNVESGTSPLKPYFITFMEIPDTASVYNMDFDGDGTDEFTGDNFEDITYLYPLENIYFPMLTVTDSSGNTYTDTIAILVVPWVETLRLLQSKWEAMKTALIAGDINTAVSYFAEDEQDEYMNYFTQLSSNDINSIFSNISRLRINSVTGNVAQCSAIRSESTGTYSYPVIFIKDGDGIWRIHGF